MTRFLSLLLLTLLPACSSFSSRWHAAAHPSPSSPPSSRWEGRWISKHHSTADGSPASGRLQAILTPAPNHTLHAEFRAQWSIFSSTYSLSLQPLHTPNHYAGSHQLPALFGGTYQYTAHLTPTFFNALYSSSYDHGSFSLLPFPPKKDFHPPQTPH